MASADDLRKQFRALPKEARESHQPYCVRIWRALSWLERAETLDSADIEGRFISTWISFNALYGQLDPDRRAYGDREAWSTFLAHIWRIDSEERLSALMQKRQMRILRIIEDKYLCHRFWLEGDSAAKVVRDELRETMARFGGREMHKVLGLLFDRLYVLRNQLLHGASTKGSRLNRRPLREAGNLLIDLVAEMLGVMITHGIDEGWGELCYPPDGPVGTR